MSKPCRPLPHLEPGILADGARRVEGAQAGGGEEDMLRCEEGLVRVEAKDGERALTANLHALARDGAIGTAPAAHIAGMAREHLHPLLDLHGNSRLAGLVDCDGAHAITLGQAGKPAGVALQILHPAPEPST